MSFFQQTQPDAQKIKVRPSSDDYILDQLCICEEKLLKMMEELENSGNDVEQLTRQMEAEEVSKLFPICSICIVCNIVLV